MNVTETAVAEQPSAPPVEAPEAAPMSVKEHAAAFTEQRAGETQEQAEERKEKAHHSAQQRREQESGQFAEGRKRTPRNDIHARMGQLTSKLDAAEKELARLRSGGGSTAQIQQAERRVEQAEAPAAPKQQAPVQRAPSAAPQPQTKTSGARQFTEPRPEEDDPKYGGDYGEVLIARAEWAGRKAYFEEREREREEADVSQRQTAAQQRIEAARERHQDFDAIADRVIQRIPKGGPLENWVFSHKKGEDVLVFFDSHPADLDAILRMPTPLEQFEAVTLLAQRVASPSSGPAGSTTSAAERKVVVLPPRPPNVVRTEAQRTSDGPPPTDGTLSVTGHRKAFHRS